MFRAVIVMSVCTTLFSLHGLAHAVPREHSLAKRSNGLVSSHRSHHQLGEAGFLDSEDQDLEEAYGRLSREYHQGGRGLISDMVKGVASKAGNVAKSALKMGHHAILPPLKGIEWIFSKTSGAFRFEKKLLKTIAGAVKSSWKLAKAVEFPGKSVVAFVFPNRIVSIVNKLTHDVMHFATKTKEAVKATVAHSLYATLTIIFPLVSRAIKTLGFDCIHMNETNLELNTGLINTVEISGGDICGLDTLRPENNITITKDDGAFMVITMPWVFRNLDAKIKSVNVVGLFGAMIKDQPVETIVKRITCKGKISFQKGTFLRFVALHLEFEEISGINVKLEGALEEGGAVAGIIDGLVGALSGVIQSHVNGKLVEIEKQISDYLLEKSRHR